MKRVASIILRSALLAISATAASAHGFEFAKVMMTGDEPMGFPGTTVSGLGAAQINNNGQVLFNATITGTGFTSANNLATYLGLPGSLGLLVQKGSQAPGLPAGVDFGGSFATPTAISLADDGRVVFGMSLEANTTAGVDSTNDTLSWIGAPGNVMPMLREGDPAPGLSGFTISQVNGSTGLFLTDSGKVFVRQELFNAGDTAGNALFAGTSPANLAPIIRDREQAPDSPAGAIVGGLSGVGPIMAKGNHVVVSGSLVQGQGGVTASNDLILWATDPNGNLKRFLREGDVVTGPDTLIDPGAQISAFNIIRINSSGTMIGENFNLLADGTHASTSTDRVVLVGSAGGPARVIAREGKPVPGLPGLSYANNLGDSRIANSGHVLLSPMLDGPGVTSDNNVAIVTGMPDDLQLVVRSGDQAPGFAPGVKLQPWSSSAYNLNGFGSVALFATVSDGLEFTSKAIYVTDRTTNQLEVVVKIGDQLEVSPGASREVSDLATSLGTSSRSYNDLSQLTFVATFTDGSKGIFVAKALVLLGDFNHNSVVDAADYVVWRDSLGQSGTGLSADGDGNGVIDPGDYDVWRANFGSHSVSGAGTSANAAVPEPSSLMLMMLTAAGWRLRRRRAA